MKHSRTAMASRHSTVVREEREHVEHDELLPREARSHMFDAVFSALEGAGVDAFAVKDSSTPGSVIGVRGDQRHTALHALAHALPGPGMYMQEWYPAGLSQPITPLSGRRIADIPPRCPAFTVAQYWACSAGDLAYGMAYGCVIEFWEPSVDFPDVYVAPRANDAAQLIHVDDLTPAIVEIEGRPRKSVAAFDRRFLAEIDFPVDAVYTWVDGEDPVWRERFHRARAEADHVDYHPEAHAANRYQSHDELRYSFRSLELYAPWIRHVYLVTDQQRPSWLVDHDQLTVVDHREIFRDPSVLPVFNSSAIISQLHHIDGLSEHYLYLNDDVFFGRDVVAEDFWHGSGIAKVFPSRLSRPFGPAAGADVPHFNISKNIRRALEASVGRSVSRAIRHTPYPQIRSVNYEIEERFQEIVEATAAQRFRSHTDIALDQLFHYYAQATGRAVPAGISYDYVNVGAASSISRLRRLLATRGRSVFCLNDAPTPAEPPLADHAVSAFLRAYFPIRSRFERAGPDG